MKKSDLYAGAGRIVIDPAAATVTRQSYPPPAPAPAADLADPPTVPPQPEIENCAACGEELDPIYINAAELCPACAHAEDLDALPHQ